MATAGLFEPASAPTGANDYDLLPYVSLPITHTEPARLAGLARLFGVPAPPADRARVLELGCASGGNLIPLAARFPDARFLGLDLSRRHVEEAGDRIASLALRNIEVRQADLATVDLGDGRFDYIICHGVFSWVPPAVQDAILRLSSRHLAADGVVTISYNVLPGWHLRQVVRDLCLLHAGASGAPQARVARARAMLNAVAAGAIVTPYGRVVAAEAKRLARMPAAYILGEFLAEHNAPCRFEDFTGRAEVHGLRWLCEADLPSTLPRVLAPKSVAAIQELAGDDPLRTQAYLDRFSGRTFRRSILVGAVAHAAAAPSPLAESVARLHVSGRFTEDRDAPADGRSHFRDAQGRPVSSAHGPTIAMLHDLALRYPASADVAALEATAGGADAQLRADLVGLISTGRVAVGSLPLRLGTRGDARPTVWPLARLEAARGQPWASSQLHTAVLLNVAMRRLVRLMDGRSSRQQLVEAAVALLPSPAAHESGIDGVLQYLSDNGLLVASTTPDAGQRNVIDA